MTVIPEFISILRTHKNKDRLVVHVLGIRMTLTYAICLRYLDQEDEAALYLSQLEDVAPSDPAVIATSQNWAAMASTKVSEYI